MHARGKLQQADLIELIFLMFLYVGFDFAQFIGKFGRYFEWAPLAKILRFGREVYDWFGSR